MQLTKQDLLEVAKQYKLSDIKSSFRKQHIVNIIVEHFIKENIFDDSASMLIKEVEIDVFLIDWAQVSIWVSKTSAGKRERRKRLWRETRDRGERKRTCKRSKNVGIKKVSVRAGV